MSRSTVGRVSKGEERNWGEFVTNEDRGTWAVQVNRLPYDYHDITLFNATDSEGSPPSIDRKQNSLDVLKR